MRRTTKVAFGAGAIAVVAAMTVAAWALTDEASDEQLAANTEAVERHQARAPGDVDGDGRTDLIVYRPATSMFWVDKSTGGEVSIALGQPGDQPTSGDFDGDARADLVAVTEGVGVATGTWHIQFSGDGSQRTVSFGVTNDVPQPGDYDGDGKDDIAVFRPAPAASDESETPPNSQWFVLKSSDGELLGIPFGVAGDIPVLGDYDGDGIADPAVQRGDTRWIKLSTDGSTVARQFGQLGDVPAAVDRDGDQRTDLAVVRADGPDESWFIERGAGGAYDTFVFGRSGMPYQQRQIGDYDGDGRTEPAMFDAESGLFWIWTADEPLVRQWGAEGDVVLPLGVDPDLGLAVGLIDGLTDEEREAAREDAPD